MSSQENEFMPTDSDSISSDDEREHEYMTANFIVADSETIDELIERLQEWTKELTTMKSDGWELAEPTNQNESGIHLVR